MLGRQRMFEKLTIVLFGLILETAGFLLGAVEHIPFVLSFTSPDYLAATQGVKTIQGGETLRESTAGFEQIARYFSMRLAHKTLLRL